MKSKNYKYILLFITLTVLATIGLQVFWNIKNYQETKRQLINEVQIAFDNSIEYYYVEDSKNDFLSFIGEEKEVSSSEFIDNIKLDTIFQKNKTQASKFSKSDTKNNTKGDTSNPEDYSNPFYRSVEISSVYIEEEISHEALKSKLELSKSKKHLPYFVKKEPAKKSDSISSVKVFKGKKASDSISKLN